MRYSLQIGLLYLYFIILSMTSLGQKRVAVIGAGYAGLATSMRLIDLACHVTLFDRVRASNDIEGDGIQKQEKRWPISGASAASSGLLHGLTPKGKLIWKASEGYAATTALIKRVERQYPSTKVILSSGSSIIRPVYADEDLFEWSKQLSHEFLEFISSEEFQSLPEGKGVSGCKGAFVYKNSTIIDSQQYLQGLLNILQDSRQCTRIEDEVNTQKLEELSHDFDAVVVASGAGIRNLWPNDAKARTLDLSYSGGQDICFPNTLGFTKALLRGDYIVPIVHNGVNVLLCGSTKEFIKDFPDDNFPTNIEKALKILTPRLQNIHPAITVNLGDVIPAFSRAGIRVIPKRTKIGRIPIADRFPLADRTNVWVITGLASRGLIHHALVGKYIADACYNNDDSLIPSELKLSAPTEAHV